MKLAFVSTVLGHPWGGSDVLWTRAAEAALGAGHGVALATTAATAAHPRLVALQHRGARWLERPPADRTRSLPRRAVDHLQRRIGRTSPLLRSLGAWRPDFVFVAQGGTFDVLADPELRGWLAASRVPHAFICQANRDTPLPDEPARIAGRAALAAARAVFFVSELNLEQARRQLADPIRTAVMVQNPMELPLDGPLPWADAGSWAFVGRLAAADKGLDLLLAGMARANCGHLTIYGTGPDESYLRHYADFLGLTDRVTWAGPASDLREVWRRHDGLALGSRREGCSLAMLEALACGRPVLLPEVGGVSDWVTDGIEGYIAPAPTVPLLAAAWARAWTERPRWSGMGVAAAARFWSQRDPAPERRLLDVASTVG